MNSLRKNAIFDCTLFVIFTMGGLISFGMGLIDVPGMVGFITGGVATSFAFAFTSTVAWARGRHRDNWIEVLRESLSPETTFDVNWKRDGF